MLTLKEAYKDYFYIGAAANARSLETHDDLLSTQFSSMTCENEMKHASVAKAIGEYDFTVADKMVNYAKDKGMQMRGHCMVWHAQMAPFIYKNEDGTYVSRDQLIANMKRHIHDYAQHFKGRIDAYDVVNEAIYDHAQEPLLRKSFWTEIIGDDFLDIAFETAALEAPEAKLFYNDYDETLPMKCDKIVKLVKGMKERGVPISGLGLQSHYNLSNMNIEDIKRAYDKYANLGLTLHITELDVSVFDHLTDKRTDVLEPTAEMIKRTADFYEEYFKILREYKDVIESVTFWGVADDYTWLDNFPVRGRKNWPLLFDTNHQPKEAFFRVTQF